MKRIPKIRSRASWGARKPRPRDTQTFDQIRELFIHWPGSEPGSWRHVNTEDEEKRTMREIQAFHMGPQRNWSDFAYSFAVFPSGRIYRGRGGPYVPAAQLGHNTGTVAVCVFLGPDDSVPENVVISLRWLKKYLEGKTGHTLKVRPHKSVTQTECPGPALTILARQLNG